MSGAAPDAQTWLAEAGRAARAAVGALALAGHDRRNAALLAAAAALRSRTDAILQANAADVAGFQGSPAFTDRLALTPGRIDAMARGLTDIAALPDPLGRVLAEWQRPNGLRFTRISAAIGVIGMIYESRPNVGADAAGICLKSGNAIILRGGSDSLRSAAAIHGAMVQGLHAAGLPEGCVQIAPTADRACVTAMLTAAGCIDLIIPRGGKSLVERVQREARVPVLAHAQGLCHTYIHRDADFAMARRVLANAKMRRTGVCGATETLLIDAAIAPALLPPLVADLGALGCDFRADPAARAILPELPPAVDFDTEWLDAVLSIAVVNDDTAAIAHIAHHGSHHTDAIITETRLPPSASWPRSTAPWCYGTPLPSSATAANSASAPRSASPPAACTRAARSASSNSPPIATSCAATARPGLEFRPRRPNLSRKPEAGDPEMSDTENTAKLPHTDEQWSAELTGEQFRVMRAHGTERPGSSPLNAEKRQGVFECAACSLPLFDASTKFESGSGWPSFFAPLADAVGTTVDGSLFMQRTEVHCRRCGGHLGHVFPDGPRPTGERYCMNGVALNFVPKEG